MYPFMDKGLSGGELYLHRTLKALTAEGLDISVFNLITEWKECTLGRPSEWDYDGIKVKLVESLYQVGSDYDAFLCHLASADPVMNWCISRKKRCYFIAHNVSDYPLIRISRNTNNPIHVIYNSEFVHGRRDFNVPHHIWTPPINIDHWKLDHDPYRNPFITFVNPIPAKGVHVFKRLAELVPHRRFLVVKGGYSVGEQVLDFPKNVHVVDPQTDMRKVYNVTRILVYMSLHESYGMCGQEAQAAGIPVIAHINRETMGLVENLGDAGLYVWDDINNMVGYIDHINSLDDHYEYTKWSIRSRKNVLDKDTKLRAPKLYEFLTRDFKEPETSKD